MLQNTLLPDTVANDLSELPYEELIRKIEGAAARKVSINKTVVAFTTDVDTDLLWNMYLDYYPASQRNNFTCNACKHFFRRAAGLVYIDPETSETKSLVWDVVPAEFQPLANSIIALIEKAKIVGPFVHTTHNMSRLGVQTAGGFNHLNLITMPITLVAGSDAAVAKFNEGYTMVTASLESLPIKSVNDTLELFRLDKDLKNYPKMVAMIEHYAAWRAALSKNHNIRHNQTWAFITTHPAASRIANTVMGEFIINLPLKGTAATKGIFEAMVDPLLYQRPQVAPSQGNVNAAEKLIAAKGLAPSLERRSAAFEDIVKWNWLPEAPSVTETPASVFGNVKTKDSPTAVKSTIINGGTVTWTIFARDVLSTVRELEVFVERTGNFNGINTAVNPDAPPLFRYDTLESRNPINDWIINGGSHCSDWGLKNDYQKVLGIKESETEDGALKFVISATKVPQVGHCLFPEVLNRDLYEIRSTIEQYSSQTPLGTIPNPVVGIAVAPASVKVTTKTGSVVTYKIDRFE